MSGIVYPKNWREIISKNEVLSGSRPINTTTLLKELTLRIFKSISYFNNESFCLALSGGIDSTTLCRLLVMHRVPFTAVTIGSAENHPDIVHAKILQEKFGFEHRIFILPEKRVSYDAYEDLFCAISDFGFRNVICADTVDEMLGGYWMHKKPEAYCEDSITEKLKWTFEVLWKDLIGEHLEPMEKYANSFNVQVSLPYLGAHELLRNIHLSQRVNGDNTKIILRELARDIGIPEEIISRPKLGLCSVWDKADVK